MNATGWAPIAADPRAEEQQRRLAYARTRSVFIASPIARHPTRQYSDALARSLVRLAELGIRAWRHQIAGASNLPRARNDLVARFCASECTDLLFVDDDMGWEPNDIVRLLASPQHVIGGVGCKKVMLPDTDPAKWCMVALDGPVRQDEMGAIEVEAVGTGFLKITRHALETIMAAHPEWKRHGWTKLPEDVRRWYYQIFRFDPNDPEECGEDIAFCRMWRGLGGTVWVDPTIRLVHVGEYEYTGNLGALLEASPDTLQGTRAND